MGSRPTSPRIHELCDGVVFSIELNIKIYVFQRHLIIVHFDKVSHLLFFSPCSYIFLKRCSKKILTSSHLAIIKLSPAGDVISHGDSTPAKPSLASKSQTPNIFQKNALTSSIHAGLSPSLWGSPAEGVPSTLSATTQITMVKKNNNINVGNKAGPMNIFQEGALMEKQIDDLGYTLGSHDIWY